MRNNQDKQQEQENLSVEQKKKREEGQDIEPQRQVDKPTHSDS
ncbi:hypothetical protein [Bacillus thermotolerans]|uniref:3-methyladenine DNA glycosylase n=1 Tax=Bacillus thermotolerans TaxID=1221996 RepID=A0A0F5I5Q8_BACTR|nr:hypothetical protein [Bacillus thermotolerans]KKB35661.1 hypothetical protein QY97_01610 [Bacillus thermotolerans]KKB40492.1 hypothetical protein QY95_01487 [Bacillus thermotolerans]KKB42881.1 hypothetical protein QY96_01226 [Bacillus thermotolerans]